MGAHTDEDEDKDEDVDEDEDELEDEDEDENEDEDEDEHKDVDDNEIKDLAEDQEWMDVFGHVKLLDFFEVEEILNERWDCRPPPSQRQYYVSWYIAGIAFPALRNGKSFEARWLAGNQSEDG